MRRLFLSVAAAAALVLVPSATQAQVSFGAVGAWHDDFDLGLGGFVGFPLAQLHEDVSGVGEFIYFFPGDEFGDLTYFEINGNLKYAFSLEDSSLRPFALGGLNIARLSVDDDTFGDVDASSTDVGLNLGGGLDLGSGGLQPSVGARIELGGGDGFVIFGSIAFGGG